MLALVSAGCSNAPAGTDSSTGNNTAATHEKALKFANGIRHVFLVRSLSGPCE
jgi:hypothetical protein